MNVWVLLQGYEYEGHDLLSVHSSLEAAQAAADAVYAEERRSLLRVEHRPSSTVLVPDHLEWQQDRSPYTGPRLTSSVWGYGEWLVIAERALDALPASVGPKE